MNLQYKNRLVLESPAPRSGKVVQNRPRLVQNRLPRHGEPRNKTLPTARQSSDTYGINSVVVRSGPFQTGSNLEPGT